MNPYYLPNSPKYILDLTVQWSLGTKQREEKKWQYQNEIVSKTMKLDEMKNSAFSIV